MVHLIRGIVTALDCSGERHEANRILVGRIKRCREGQKGLMGSVGTMELEH